MAQNSFSEINIWKEKMKKKHPRILITSYKDFERIKDTVEKNDQAKKFYSKLKEEVNTVLNEPPAKYEIPDGLRLLSTSVKVLRRVYLLSFFYRIEGDKKYIERLWKELEAAGNFPDWNPRHFLDTAEMAHAFAIAYDWMYDIWSEEQRKFLKEAIVKKALELAYNCYSGKAGYGWWTKSKYNWNQVCNGGIGIAAIAIFEEKPEFCEEILNNAINSLKIAMREFAPDGGWPEGPTYWRYATFYNFLFLASLESATGSDLGFLKMEGVSETGFFPIYLTGPTGKTFNFADSVDVSLKAPQMFYLSKKFNRPVYSWYAINNAQPHVLDLIWFNPVFSDPQKEKLPLDRYFRHVEVVTMRSSWNNTEACFVGFKAGDNKFGHAHLDTGCFVLDCSGYRWVVDLGADNYNLPGYFGRERWNYYRLRAEGHNTVVINPSNLPDQDPKAETKIVKFISKPEKCIAIADLTPAYSKDAEKVERGIMLNRKEKFVVIKDEIKLKKTGEIYWFIHTPSEIEMGENGKKAILKQKDWKLELIITSPENASFIIMDAKPLSTSPNPEKQAENTGIKKLAINLRDIISTKIEVVFIPLKDSEKIKNLSEVIPFLQWD